MNSDNGFTLAWDANCATGESPVWDDRRGILWFCDSPARRLLGFSPVTGARWRFQINDVVGGLSLCEDGRLLLALSKSVAFFDPIDGDIERFVDIPDIPDGFRLNDCKVGPDGAFWVGTADLQPAKRPLGTLYRVSPSGTVERKGEGYKASNGLAWSPDGRTMLHSDSRGPTIDAYAFDVASGVLTNRRRVATLSVADGRPDGGACDADGRYWSAGISAGCLNVFALDGTLVAKHPFPVPSPAMPCFTPHGLFVTSSWNGLPLADRPLYPAAGGLFVRKEGVPEGAPVPLFPVSRKESP